MPNKNNISTTPSHFDIELLSYLFWIIGSYFFMKKYNKQINNPIFKITAPKTVAKPGIFALSFPEVFALCCFSGAGSMFAAVLPSFFSTISVLGSGRIVVSVSEFALNPFAGCISVPVAVVLPVIAKGENPGVCAVKYRYLSSSSDRPVGN